MTGRTHPRPPSCLPQSRSQHKARRRALSRRDTETGCARRATGGEEPEAVQMVPAQGDQLGPFDRRVWKERGAEGESSRHCVYQPNVIGGMDFEMQMQ
jgi:hypothetical protein